MTVEQSRPKSASKTVLNSTTTASIGRFYEKRQQFDDALDQYSKVLTSKPDDTATYIDRSRVFLKLGSINRAQEDTDVALNLIDDTQQNSNLLLYYVCLQKAEILYANGEFELALMYFHRANKIKPAQQICLEGIEKTTEILQCTICNPATQLTIISDLADLPNQSKQKSENLLHRSPIRKQIPSVELPLTEYTDNEANRLLLEISKDRQLLMNLYTDPQLFSGFTGLSKAKIEAQQAISILESQLKFLDKSECLHLNHNHLIDKNDTICTPEMDRQTLIHIAEKELSYLQNLSSKEKNIEILYRSMKIINCLQSSETSHDQSISLLLAEAFRLVGQSYHQMKLLDQSSENYKHAYELLLPLNDNNCLYRSLFDFGRSLILISNYTEALKIFLEMFTKTTTDNERAFVCQYISFCYLNLKNYSQAKLSAYQSLDYASKSNDELLTIESNILLGKIFLKLKDFQRAEDYLQYARNSKDYLGDLTQMKYLDELLNHIKLAQKTTTTEQQGISSIIDQPREYFHWRILTPYYHLFEK